MLSKTHLRQAIQSLYQKKSYKMIEEVFEEFFNLFSERCNTYPLLLLGEDTIRYDFFYAITVICNLRPSQIQIEVPIHSSSFIPRSNQNSYRKEKPQMDLVVETEKLNISVEFAMFKQNSNEDGTVNSTERTVKFMNDMMRLAIDSIYTKRKGYFICVADDTFLGHQLNTKLIGRFPSHYIITPEIIDRQMTTKTSKFDDRFLSVLKELNGNIKADIIFDRDVVGEKIHRITKILIWEVQLC